MFNRRKADSEEGCKFDNGVPMQNVLKFPLRSVKRSTESKENKSGDAEILFFTGIRYERHPVDESTSVLKTGEAINKR